jgi:hypothetical protein
MNIVTLLKDFRDLVHQDAAVQAWCQANYGAPVRTALGVDARNPPATTVPVVCFLPLEKDTGYGVETKEHLVGVSCGLYDDTLAAPVYEGAAELAALAKLEEFRALVLAALRKTAIDGLIFQRVQTKYDTEEFFPNFYADMALTIEQPRAFREDPYE